LILPRLCACVHLPILKKSRLDISFLKVARFCCLCRYPMPYGAHHTRGFEWHRKHVSMFANCCLLFLSVRIVTSPFLYLLEVLFPWQIVYSHIHSICELVEESVFIIAFVYREFWTKSDLIWCWNFSPLIAFFLSSELMVLSYYGFF